MSCRLGSASRLFHLYIFLKCHELNQTRCCSLGDRRHRNSFSEHLFLDISLPATPCRPVICWPLDAFLLQTQDGRETRPARSDLFSLGSFLWPSAFKLQMERASTRSVTNRSQCEAESFFVLSDGRPSGWQTSIVWVFLTAGRKTGGFKIHKLNFLCSEIKKRAGLLLKINANLIKNPDLPPRLKERWQCVRPPAARFIVLSQSMMGDPMRTFSTYCLGGLVPFILGPCRKGDWCLVWLRQ